MFKLMGNMATKQSSERENTNNCGPYYIETRPLIFFTNQWTDSISQRPPS